MVQISTQLPDRTDTIVALSSATGPGARAIVRLSGRQAKAILGALTDDPAIGPRCFAATSMRIPGLQAPIPADVYLFAAPRTYTGQDIVEIHTISSPPIIDALVAACLNAGARPAQPGEFTLRAFLAGKLDLTRAEAVLAVIEADNRHDLAQAVTQLAGGMATPLSALREDLLGLLTDVEAALDFADEDIQFIAADDLLKRIGMALAHLTNLQKDLERRAVRQRLFRVVLAGKPNAGKSSLFNALLGTDAALVSAKPGTTRDYLEMPLTLNDVVVQFVDTAGQREGADAIETAAQSLASQQAASADLIVWCQSCDDAAPVPAIEKCLCVATKSDLGPPPAGVLATSAATGAGLDGLRSALRDAARRAGHAALAPSLSRCAHHVDACLHHLRQAHAVIIDEAMPELLALEIRLALDELGAIVGAIYTNDLLDRIFSRFCIGK